LNVQGFDHAVPNRKPFFADRYGVEFRHAANLGGLNANVIPISTKIASNLIYECFIDPACFISGKIEGTFLHKASTKCSLRKGRNPLVKTAYAMNRNEIGRQLTADFSCATPRLQSIGHASLHPLEFLYLKIVFLQQLIKIGAVLTGELRGLANVAFRHGKNLNQVISFKCIARILEGS
jgi:hypothetical protein